jgi:HEAT repeat protein
MISPEGFAVTPEERQRLTRIERFVADGAAGIAPLVDLLDDSSWTVRRAVVAGLAAGGSAAIAPLCRALHDRRDSEARIAATVDALAALEVDGDLDAALTAMAGDPDPAIVADMAQILGRRRSRGALPTLAALIHHQDDNVAVAAIEALGRVGGRAAVDPLVEAVQSGNFFRIFPAIDVLGRSGDPRAVAPLTALLDEPQYAAEAARALGRTGDRAAVAPLMALVGRGGGAIVRIAALALNELRQRNAEHFGSGERIEGAITEARTAGTVRQLVRALSDGEAPEKASLCFVLAVLRDPSTVPALTALLEGPVEVVEAASNALKQLGPEAAAQILH